MARPRKKTEPEALQEALLLFWDRGYDRTSLSDLSKALGVGPSSIYSTFGSKADLFQRALYRYMDDYAGFVSELIANSSTRGAENSLRDILRGAVELYTSPGHPCGCAMLEGGGADRSESSEGGAIAREFIQKVEKGLQGLFENAGSDETLARSPRILAQYTLGTMRGLSQLARDGSSKEDLMEIADLALGACFAQDTGARDA